MSPDPAATHLHFFLFHHGLQNCCSRSFRHSSTAVPSMFPSPSYGSILLETSSAVLPWGLCSFLPRIFFFVLKTHQGYSGILRDHSGETIWVPGAEPGLVLCMANALPAACHSGPASTRILCSTRVLCLPSNSSGSHGPSRAPTGSLDSAFTCTPVQPHSLSVRTTIPLPTPTPLSQAGLRLSVPPRSPQNVLPGLVLGSVSLAAAQEPQPQCPQEQPSAVCCAAF